MQNWKSVSTFGEIIAKIQRKWKNPCKIWSVSNMTTCSNWIRQCWRHCQASSYLSCGNVQLPIPKKDKQHPPNIDWWEAGSDCIVFQPIHTIQAIVWKGLHWVVLASKAHRMFWLCSCFEFDAWALLSDKSVAWATFQSATSTNCRINVPWMALAPQLLLFACPTNTPVISNHATAHSLLVHLARDVHPNNIRNFLADVVDHCELNLTLMTLHIPLLEYCRLPCKVCLPWGAIFGMDSISQLLIIGVHQCCFEIPFAMRVRKRDMAIHHGKLQHIMSLLRVRSQFLHLGQQLQAGGAWTFTHHLLGYLPQKRTFLLLMLSEPCWWVMGLHSGSWSWYPPVPGPTCLAAQDRSSWGTLLSPWQHGSCQTALWSYPQHGIWCKEDRALHLRLDNVKEVWRKLERKTPSRFQWKFALL